MNYNFILEPLFYIIFIYFISGLVLGLILLISPLNKFLGKPIDFNCKYRNKRIFGKNKTWRMVIAGIVGAWFGIYILDILINIWHPDWPFIKELLKNPLLTAVIFGFLGETGELLNSFIKRRKGILPGNQNGFIHFFFDQTDVFIASVFWLSLFIKPAGWTFFFIGLLEVFLLHWSFTFVVKKLGIKTDKGTSHNIKL